MRVRLEGKAQDLLLEGQLLGRGGEASIYAVAGRPDLAAKLYHNPTDEQADKLAAMLAAPPVAPPQRGQHVAIAWPMGRLLEATELSAAPQGENAGTGRVIGYLMPRIEKARLIWEIYNPGVRREICPQFHYGLLLRTARNLAAVVRTLHECGYVLGDLNESNVLVTPQALVTLIDADSFQVPGSDRLFRCRVGRAEYTPPELQGVAFADVDRLPQHDAFALAVLIFQLLMQGIHPFAGTCLSTKEPDTTAARITEGDWPYSWTRTTRTNPSPHAPPWFALPPSVQDLLRRCFEDSHAQPDLRPGAAEWQEALEEAEQQLTNCASDGQHFYPRGLDRCPGCDPRIAAAALRDGFSSGRLRNSARPEVRADGKNASPRKVVDDPLPPRHDTEPVATVPTDGGVELALQALGRGLDQRSWLIWLGVALIGVVAGILYALERALPGYGLRP